MTFIIYVDMYMQEGQYLLSQEKDLASQVQFLIETIYFSLCTNTLRKGMNPSLLLQAINSRVNRNLSP